MTYFNGAWTEDMVVEKNLRGVLRSEVDRSVSRDGIIIVDSLNNIKVRAALTVCLACSGIRYCVEKGEPSYDSNIFEDLVRRFERPDRRSRWDSPLFELFPSRESGFKTRDVKVLQPTIATQSCGLLRVIRFYEMDKATQEVVSAIVEAQSGGLGVAMNKISWGLANYILYYWLACPSYGASDDAHQAGRAVQLERAPHQQMLTVRRGCLLTT
ncbi:hypothetical protein ZWY2020_035781 [Hordeum vulgare]|nr:hypothetical protein ZWY2020_035781 [Hordeum vulgare]